MTLWETYKTQSLIPKDDEESYCNMMGKQGWEPWAREVHWGGSSVSLYFKRPISSCQVAISESEI